METVRFDFTRDEIALRDKLIRIYITQVFIINKYTTTFEMFGRVVRNPRIIPDTSHFYCGAEYKPGPQDIRKAITRFFITV